MWKLNQNRVLKKEQKSMGREWETTHIKAKRMGKKWASPVTDTILVMVKVRERLAHLERWIGNRHGGCWDYYFILYCSSQNLQVILIFPCPPLYVSIPLLNSIMSISRIPIRHISVFLSHFLTQSSKASSTGLLLLSGIWLSCPFPLPCPETQAYIDWLIH